MRILDLYDDPSVSVLRSSLGERPLPAKLASFEPVAPEALQQLPDRLFALVGTVHGEPLRKYAMHDEPHLATSILYFLERGSQLPEGVRAKVAKNLITACDWYETTPPIALLKLAFVGQALGAGLTLAGAPGILKAEKQKSQDSNTAFRAAQMSGVKQASGVTVNSPAEAEDALEKFLRGEEKADYSVLDDTGYPNPFTDGKKADLRGTPAGASGGVSAGNISPTPQKRFATAPKVSSWGEVGDFAFEALPAPVPEVVHYALPHRELYPIDTEAQVKRASAYFHEHHRAFDDIDRRAFAVSVVERAEELGISLQGLITKIASGDYGPFIAAELQGRIRALEGTGKEAAYEVLMENLHQTPPIVMYDLLKVADEQSGVDAGYGRPVTGFKEPLSAVFGAPEKPIYSWAGRGHYVSEEMLRSYAKRMPNFEKVIDADFTKKFVQDPVKAFDCLPDDQKIVIARFANQEAFRYV